MKGPALDLLGVVDGEKDGEVLLEMEGVGEKVRVGDLEVVMLWLPSGKLVPFMDGGTTL